MTYKWPLWQTHNELRVPGNVTLWLDYKLLPVKQVVLVGKPMLSNYRSGTRRWLDRCQMLHAHPFNSDGGIQLLQASEMEQQGLYGVWLGAHAYSPRALKVSQPPLMPANFTLITTCSSSSSSLSPLQARTPCAPFTNFHVLNSQNLSMHTRMPICWVAAELLMMESFVWKRRNGPPRSKAAPAYVPAELPPPGSCFPPSRPPGVCSGVAFQFVPRASTLRWTWG